ncbi:MAG: bifunctional folylpolyglutamate synthase/dihydrofolate synthase, partial [Pyrinomonadaceae bacterium]
MPPDLEFEEAVRYLLSLGHETLSIKLGLETIERLLCALNHPQQKFQSVQIAGTNGKGSTAAMVNQICLSAGIKTGLYTSPHLVSITERIRINGEQITQADFARIAARVREAANELKLQDGALPTFFEQVTAIALVAFAEMNVDLAILETGLGGRLDATTAARAKIAALTQIDYDHQEYLGNTLELIAAEKVAIVRPDSIFITTRQNPEVMRVIESHCREVGTRPVISGGSLKVNGADTQGHMRVQLCCEDMTGDEFILGLRGRHQISNASLAVDIARALGTYGFRIDDRSIMHGLEHARHPGRLELIKVDDTKPALLFDGAHNPAGALTLHDFLQEFIKGPVTMIFGAMKDKEIYAMAKTLFSRAAIVILTQVSNPRTAMTADLVTICQGLADSDDAELPETISTGSPLEAMNIAMNRT